MSVFCANDKPKKASPSTLLLDGSNTGGYCLITSVFGIQNDGDERKHKGGNTPNQERCSTQLGKGRDNVGTYHCQLSLSSMVMDR